MLKYYARHHCPFAYSYVKQVYRQTNYYFFVMTDNALGIQIADQLASARCEQDLDHELSQISEQHWQMLVDYLRALIEEMEEKEPGRAKAIRSLMQSYLERWHRLKRRRMQFPI